jgi:putative membrane protein
MGALLCLGAAAQSSSSSMQANSTSNHEPLTSQGKQFIGKAAEANMAEVKLGKLALQKSHSDQVKRFAQRMIDDHGSAEVRLQGVAQEDNVQLPKGPSTAQQAQYNHLAKLSADDFDSAYVNDMVSDHKKDVAEFKHMQSEIKNPALKNWVSETLPVIEGHLQKAENLGPIENKSGMQSRMQNPAKP